MITLPPTIRCLWHSLATKLTAPETISHRLLLKKRKNRSLSHPLGHLGVTYALHLWLVGKPMVDFIFVVIELFSLSPTIETLWAEIGRSRRFSKGGGSLWAQISDLLTYLLTYLAPGGRADVFKERRVKWRITMYPVSPFCQQDVPQPEHFYHRAKQWSVELYLEVGYARFH